MTSKEFIEQNKHKPSSEIALLLSKKPDLDKTFIISQINGIQKAKKKLPEFYKNNKIVYPVTLSMEQCSSEQTAILKSKLIEGNSIIDLTGGFGIDSYYFSKIFKHVTYIEQNKELFNTVSENFKSLSAPNIKTINNTAEEFLKTNSIEADLIYIDPSRRDESKRVFRLEDCTPNIIELTDRIFDFTNKILIKTAPLLDIKQSIKDLRFVSKVYVISVNNDCKEVLYLLDKTNNSEIEIHTVNITKETQQFNFLLNDEEHTNSSLSNPKTYLYEPNSAILKAGAFKSVCDRFNIDKIAVNSHLYTSHNLITNFPGRIFKIENVCGYNPKSFKKLGLKQANITCRNFIDKPDVVKKKLKLKDGGDYYVFATTDNQDKSILINCKKC